MSLAHIMVSIRMEPLQAEKLAGNKRDMCTSLSFHGTFLKSRLKVAGTKRRQPRTSPRTPVSPLSMGSDPKPRKADPAGSWKVEPKGYLISLNLGSMILSVDCLKNTTLWELLFRKNIDKCCILDINVINPKFLRNSEPSLLFPGFLFCRILKLC